MQSVVLGAFRSARRCAEFLFSLKIPLELCAPNRVMLDEPELTQSHELNKKQVLEGPLMIVRILTPTR